jgi:hypothetical protein
MGNRGNAALAGALTVAHGMKFTYDDARILRPHLSLNLPSRRRIIWIPDGSDLIHGIRNSSSESVIRNN